MPRKCIPLFSRFAGIHVRFTTWFNPGFGRILADRYRLKQRAKLPVKEWALRNQRPFCLHGDLFSDSVGMLVGSAIPSSGSISP
jgi:hypothetical protein